MMPQSYNVLQKPPKLFPDFFEAVRSSLSQSFPANREGGGGQLSKEVCRTIDDSLVEYLICFNDGKNVKGVHYCRTDTPR